MKSVAIYHANNDVSEFTQRNESDATKVKNILIAAGAQFDYAVFDLPFGDFPADPTAFDAVIITGSPAFVEDGDEWILRLFADIRIMVAAKIPLIGLCFGHQAILSALGSEVVKTSTWICGATDFDVFQNRPWMQPTQSRVRLYAANLAQANNLPSGFDLLGGSELCPIALTALGDYIFTTQFHPEMDSDYVADLIEEMAPLLGAQLDDCRSSIVKGAEGALFGQWARRFIEMDRA
ncbi:MAG: hypothetical protein QNL16_00605 [Rhodobacterales bacterium]|jgi:GMP synthase-like glutamine amidotransferase|nr:hypothetical protein [Rhodobacter sp.]